MTNIFSHHAGSCVVGKLSVKAKAEFGGKTPQID